MTTLSTIGLVFAFLFTVLFFVCLYVIWVAAGESDVNGEKERDARE